MDIQFTITRLAMGTIKNKKKLGRYYSVSFETKVCQSCDSPSTYYFKLINNCIRDSTQPVTCLSYERVTETQTFIPASQGESVSISWIDDDIYNITEIEIGVSSGSNGWGLGQFSILIDNNTNLWINCSLDFMQFLWFDEDCSEDGGYQEVVIELSKICTSDPNSNSNFYSIAANTNSTRKYSIYLDTESISGCESSGSMSLTLINNCTIHSTTRYDCDKTSYSTTSITIGSFSSGTRKWYNFNDSDIGEITNILIVSNSNDGWCLSDFGILINDENNKWSNCSMGFMTRFLLDGDCSSLGGNERLLIDVTSDSVICDRGLFCVKYQVHSVRCKKETKKKKIGSFYIFLFRFFLESFSFLLFLLWVVKKNKHNIVIYYFV